MEPATPGINIKYDDVYSGTYQNGYELLPGQTLTFTLAFPQVQFSRTKSPLSAKHAAEAQAAGCSRLGTIDRPGGTARRKASLANSGLKPNSKDDRDEYPPAVFRQNNGRASVKYVPLSDNRAAGKYLRDQITGVSAANPIFKDGDTVELIVTP